MNLISGISDNDFINSPNVVLVKKTSRTTSISATVKINRKIVGENTLIDVYIVSSSYSFDYFKGVIIGNYHRSLLFQKYPIVHSANVSGHIGYIYHTNHRAIIKDWTCSGGSYTVLNVPYVIDVSNFDNYQDYLYNLTDCYLKYTDDVGYCQVKVLEDSEILTTCKIRIHSSLEHFDCCPSLNFNPILKALGG